MDSLRAILRSTLVRTAQEHRRILTSTNGYYLVQFVLFPQPFYDGPQRIEELNPTTLTAALTDPNTYVVLGM